MEFSVDFFVLMELRYSTPRIWFGLSRTIWYKVSRYPRKYCRKEPGTKYMDKWYRNLQKFLKGNTSEGINFFLEIFRRNKPYHLNSTRNNRFFHANGKRSSIENNHLTYLI